MGDELDSEAEPQVTWWRRLFALVGQLFVGHDVFISYSRTDASELARSLHVALVARKLTVFLDDGKLEAGAALSSRLERAARFSSVCAVFVTRGAIEHPTWIGTEVRAATTSWLRSAIVAIVAPPLICGRVPPPFESLNRFRGLDTRSALADEIVTTLRRRRLRRRRVFALAVTLSAIGLLIHALQARAATSSRALVASEWTARAERSASSGRFDLAEYAITKAIEADPSTREHLTRTYDGYRAHRLAVPGIELALAGDERVVAVAGQHALIAGERAARLLDLATGAATALECQAGDRIVECEPGRRYVFCQGVVVTLDQRRVSETSLDESVVDASCVAGRAVALVEDDHRQMWLLDLQTHQRKRVFASRNWVSAGLCRDEHRAFGAWIEGDRVTLELDGAGESRVFTGALTATVMGSCRRPLVAYSAETEGAPLGPSTEHWTLLDWPLDVRRALPAIQTWYALPDGSGYAGVYLARSGDVALVPLVDAIVRQFAPSVVAVGATSLALLDPDKVLTVSLEGGDLVIRDRGVVAMRRPTGMDAPARVVASYDVIVVDGGTSARVWRRPTTSADVTPSSKSVERELALTDRDLRELQP